MDLHFTYQPSAQSADSLAAFIRDMKAPVAEEVLIAQDSEVWKQTNCLECANCCKTKTPVYTESDIGRIAAYLGITTGQFEQDYLLIYASGEKVNLSVPCPFLGDDNKCVIYAVRPEVCAGYPHHFRQGFALWQEKISANIAACPATYRLAAGLERLNAQEEF